jgi:hypothetical protein
LCYFAVDNIAAAIARRPAQVPQDGCGGADEQEYVMTGCLTARVALSVAIMALAAGGFAAKAQAAAGDLAECTTSIRGQAIKFVYDPEIQALKDSRSWRERSFGDWGEVTCPGLVTLRALTPELDDAGRAPFCLQWDKAQGTYIGYAEGERDAWFSCRSPSKSFCQRVKASKTAATTIAGKALNMAETGLEVAHHPSGAVLMNGPGAAIAQQLSTLGTTVVAGATAPVALAGAAVTAVAVGGAVYVCSEDGAEAAALQAAPEQQLKDGDQISDDADGASLLGAQLPKGDDVPAPADAAAAADKKGEEVGASN